MPEEPASPQPDSAPAQPNPEVQPVVLGAPEQPDSPSPLDSSEQTQQTDTPQPTVPLDEPPQKPNIIRRILNRMSIYAWIFLAGLALVGLIVGTVVLQAKKNNPAGTTQVTSLTDKQIAELKGSAVVVGSSKQTLDVQSAAIFDSQVLMRSDLSVAGTIKGGGAASFASITIGGAGDFSDIHINNSLAVVGGANVAGQLNVQKGLNVSGASSLGVVTASQITASGLSLSGDITFTHHINTSGGPPSQSGGSALGSGGTSSLSGTDTAGTITANIGSGPAAGTLASVTFTAKFASTPHVIISPASSGAAGLPYYVIRSSNGFSIALSSPPTAGATLVFDYFVVD